MQLRMTLTTLNGWKKIERAVIFLTGENYVKFKFMSIVVLLERSHTYSFTWRQGLLSSYKGGSNDYKGCVAHKAKNIYYLSIYRKNLSTSVHESLGTNTTYWLEGHTSPQPCPSA